MDAIRLQNLRSLVDTGFINLKPITVLVGENSSGKSTFLRTFPLLRQSIESRTTGPLLWYGKYVDFGSFTESLYSNAKVEEITLHFQIPNRVNTRRVVRYYNFHKQFTFDRSLSFTTSLGIKYLPKTDTSYVSSCEIKFSNHMVKLNLSPSSIQSLYVNSTDITSLVNDFTLAPRYGPIPYFLKKERSGQARFFHEVNEHIMYKLLNNLSHHFRKNTSTDKLLEFIFSIEIGSSDSMLDSMKNSSFGTITWKSRVKDWTVDTNDFIEFRDLLLGLSVFGLLDFINENIAETARNSIYIAPVRATAERYYRSQNLAVDEVDFQGQNLAMYLRNLTDSEIKTFSKWTEEFFDFKILTRSIGGQISIRIHDTKTNIETNLTDTGFGYSQILPIIVQLWSLTQNRLIRSVVQPIEEVLLLIEQPELHLHPRMQALIADSFINVNNSSRKTSIKTKIIVETHSQTIINRLGHRVRRGDISKEDINIVVFEKDQFSPCSCVSVGTYDEKGFLKNWPIGFFEPERI